MLYRLDVGDPVEHAPFEIAERLCAFVDNDPDDLYSQALPHDELKLRFRAASSAAALVRLAFTLGETEGGAV